MAKKKKKKSKQNTISVYEAFTTFCDEEESYLTNEYAKLCETEENVKKKHKKHKKKVDKSYIMTDSLYKECQREQKYYDNINNEIESMKSKIESDYRKVSNFRKIATIVIALIGAVGGIALEIVKIVLEIKTMETEASQPKKKGWFHKNPSYENPDKYRIKISV